MRPIKFRAWDKEHKLMTEAFGLKDNFCGPLGTLSLWEDVEHNPKYELMQFTGLLDKNGKEIYEGDIVRFQMYGQAEHGQGVVRFPEDYMWLSTYEEPIEVIGNIYENRDLLNKE